MLNPDHAIYKFHIFAYLLKYNVNKYPLASNQFHTYTVKTINVS